MATRKRMTAFNRKQAIVEAARPLFAQNGFHGTSVRNIARAADISEALLYKHFESKEALYDQTMDYAGEVSATALEKLRDLEIGTEALVAYIYFLVRLILLKAPRVQDRQHWHERFLFRSLLGDARYARTHFRNLHGIMEERISACFDKAAEAGDLAHVPIGNVNRMWLVHHLAMALNLCHMSDEPAFEYDCTKQELAEQAILFCLRGIGMTESAIDRHFQVSKLREMFERVYG